MKKVRRAIPFVISHLLVSHLDQPTFATSVNMNGDKSAQDQDSTSKRSSVEAMTLIQSEIPVTSQRVDMQRDDEMLHSSAPVTNTANRSANIFPVVIEFVYILRLLGMLDERLDDHPADRLACILVCVILRTMALSGIKSLKKMPRNAPVVK